MEASNDENIQACLPSHNVPFDLPQAVLATMRYVEVKAAEDPELRGSQKLLLFRRAFKQVLQFAHNARIIDTASYGTLLEWSVTGAAMIEGMIETFIAISKDPGLIQLKEEVKASCTALCKKRKGK